MSHTAYELACLVQDPNLALESVTLWKSDLYVGCHDGSLWVYGPKEENAPAQEEETSTSNPVSDATEQEGPAATKPPPGPALAKLGGWGDGWGVFMGAGAKPASTPTAGNPGSISPFGLSLRQSSIDEGEESVDVAGLLVLREKVGGFSKRPVLQLDTLARSDLLLSLAECVRVHRLPSLALHATLTTTRGATLYAWDDERGMLAVVRPRRLNIFRFSGLTKEFTDIREVVLAEAVRTVAWCGDSVCVGLARDYKLVNTKTGAVADVFPAGRAAPPLALALPRGELLLGKDNIGVFIDSTGKSTRAGGLSWSEPPTGVAVAPPYALGRLSRFIEVRSLRPPYALVQTLPLRSLLVLRALVLPEACVLAAGDGAVFRLQPRPLEEQVQQLLAAAKFEDALALCQLFPEEEAEARARLEDETHQRCARSLFALRKYDSALEHFAAAPSVALGEVLALFLALRLPGGGGGQGGGGPRAETPTPTDAGDASRPSTPPPGEGARAMAALASFLRGQRPALLRRASVTPVPGSLADADAPAAAAPTETLGLLDTALVQAAVAAGHAEQAAQLLNSRNFADIPITEQYLMTGGLFPELLALYRSQGQHRTALELLIRWADAPPGPGPPEGAVEYGPQSVADYLQRVVPPAPALVREFVPWLLARDPERGVQLLTTAPVPLPSEEALQLLRRHAPTMQAHFLEHLLHGTQTHKGQQATEPALEKELVALYLERVREEHAKSGRGHPWAESSPSPARAKLLELLARTRLGPRHAEQLMQRLPPAALLYERALLLGEMGRHRAALALLARKLRDSRRALEYCDARERGRAGGAAERNTLPGAAARDSLYWQLLLIYLEPHAALLDYKDAMDSAGSAVEEDVEAGVMLAEALDLAARHWADVDAGRLLRALPPTVPLQGLMPLLVPWLRKLLEMSRNDAVVRSLQRSEHVSTRTQLAAARSPSVTVTAETTCALCRRRIGTSVFAVRPNKSLVHFGCMDLPDQAKRMGTPRGQK